MGPHVSGGHLRTLILNPLSQAWLDPLYPKVTGMKVGSGMVGLRGQRRWVELRRYNLLIRDKEDAN